MGEAMTIGSALRYIANIEESGPEVKKLQIVKSSAQQE